MLPSIKISLPILLALWCIASVWAFKSPVMLLYPLMWIGVAGLFLVVTKYLPDNEETDSSESA